MDENASLVLTTGISGPARTLSDLESRILEFERNWWRYAGAKESAIKELFDLNAPRYYQLLNDLIDREDALVASPMLVKRLRRLRLARMNARSGR
ncbi:MAG: DUF3263 domain-containing protein [Actinobacteria bacterium]|nr:DUF3263 domain-containing protein [Actinomycetota bacterium]